MRWRCPPTLQRAHRPEPAFADRCRPPAAGSATRPLLATTGYESSPWTFERARSSAVVRNSRDVAVVPLERGMISLYMPEGHTSPGPMRFDMLTLASPDGPSGTFTFDGHTISRFRLINGGPFPGTAGPSFVTPPHPGQFNSYLIDPGHPLNFSVNVDGHSISDVAANALALKGYMYRQRAASGFLESFLVYEGDFPIGDDPKNPITLSMHLEFRYGVNDERADPPTIDIDVDSTGGDVTVTATPKPGSGNETFFWVGSKELDPKAPQLGMGAKLELKPGVFNGKWISVLVHSKDAQVWRHVPVCIDPKGC